MFFGGYLRCFACRRTPAELKATGKFSLRRRVRITSPLNLWLFALLLAWPGRVQADCYSPPSGFVG